MPEGAFRWADLLAKGAFAPSVSAWDREPEKYQGELRNTPPRPVDRYQQNLAETLSPTMAGYSGGQMAADAYRKGQAGDWGGAFESGAPLLAMAFAPGVPKGKGIRAFHGSPHDFDAFDASKIGTGEGAQAYGHGLYFAESEGVARNYRDALGRPHAKSPFMLEGGAGLVRGEGAHGQAFDWLNIADGDVDAAIARAAKDPNEARRGEVLGVLQKWKDAGVHKTPIDGKMYEVRLNAEPEQFLDWDKPLSQQSADIQTAFKALPPYDDYLPAGRVFESLSSELNSKGGAPTVSDQLRQQGVPGIRYLDQGSRGKGEGTYNYVVFRGNEHLIEIVKKYGIAGAAAMLGMSQTDVADAMETGGAFKKDKP